MDNIQGVVKSSTNKESVHYKNAAGVRAICSDCHVPKEWGPKVIRKIKATGELWGWVTQAIRTRPKFEAMREKLAVKVWLEMKANDSHECRNCHSYEAMDFISNQTFTTKAVERDMAHQ